MGQIDVYQYLMARYDPDPEKGWINRSKISTDMGLNSDSVTQSLRKLRQRGDVEFRFCPTDSRAFEYKAIPEGECRPVLEDEEVRNVEERFCNPTS